MIRNNAKNLLSKIKEENNNIAYKNYILIQKFEGKKTILFATNFKKELEDIKNIYNIKNRGIDAFDQYLSISSIQRRCKKWYEKVLLFGIDASIINA